MSRFKIKFNKEKFTTDLIKGIKADFSIFIDNTLDIIKSNLKRQNLLEVDEKHLTAMVQSIRAVVTSTNNYRIVGTFYGGKKGGKTQSFRVVYYEHGTGKKMMPPANYSNTDDITYNKARKGGKVIYQRPRGEWTDLGGNVHYSKLKGDPKPLKEWIDKGKEIAPTFFFIRSIYSSFKFNKDLLQMSVKDIDIGTYIGMTKKKSYKL
jgi:hypothetical protein